MPLGSTKENDQAPRSGASIVLEEPHLEEDGTGKMSEFTLPVHRPQETFHVRSLFLREMALRICWFKYHHILVDITCHHSWLSFYLRAIPLEARPMVSKVWPWSGMLVHNWNHGTWAVEIEEPMVWGQFRLPETLYKKQVISRSETSTLLVQKQAPPNGSAADNGLNDSLAQLRLDSDQVNRKISSK